MKTSTEESSMKKICYLFFTFYFLIPLQIWANPLEPETAESLSPQLSQKVNDARGVAEKQRLKAGAEAETARELKGDSGNLTEKALASYLEQLQSYRKKLSEEKLRSLKAIEEQISLMKKRTADLSLLKKRGTENPQSVSTLELEESSVIWRKIVDETILSLFRSDQVDFGETPVWSNEGLEDVEDFEELRRQILLVKQEVNEERLSFESSLSKLRTSERDARTRLLLGSGRVRADLMNLLIQRGEFSVWELSSIRVKDFLREVQIVPYRIVAVFVDKYFVFKDLLGSGVEGWFEVAKQLFLLLLVLALPFALFKVFRWMSAKLDQLRTHLFQSARVGRVDRTNWAVWIGRLNPYLPWIFAFLTTAIATKLLSSTLLGPLVSLLPYVGIYILFRICRIFLGTLLSQVLLSKSLRRAQNQKRLVQKTSNRLSSLFFLEWAILHATQDVVRKALVYNLLFDLLVLVNLIVIGFVARQWKAELLGISKQWLSLKVHNFISGVNSIWGELIGLPILLFANIIFISARTIFQWLSQFDIGKRISSEIFKKRLEEASGEKESLKSQLPEDYLNLFLGKNRDLSSEIQVDLARGPLKFCLESLERWKNGKSSEDLLLVFGTYGIGKSTFLSQFERALSEDMKVSKIRVEKKVYHHQGVFELMSRVLGAEIQSTEELVAFDEKSEKRVIIFDDIHNLYLNYSDGLEAYRQFVEITTLQLENIFWCLSCDQRVMAHLEGLFGKNHFLGKRVELKSWNDSEIQDLILKRHNLSEKNLSFDRLISAVHRDDIMEASSGLEVQFFRLLWGQSRGNPLAAQALWLTSAQPRGDRNLKITVPEFCNPKSLSGLDDSLLLVFAAIVKHENLGEQELAQVCDLGAGTVKRAIKVGEDAGILQRFETGRWRVEPKAQHLVHSQLSGRNLIYG